MIVAGLQTCSRYNGCFPALGKALEWLAARDLSKLEPGRHEIDGDRMFASITDYRTKPPAEGFWEAHRRYIDVQAVVSGRERFGFGRLDEMRLVSHDESRDLSVLEGEGDFFELQPGIFAVLFPEDAHMPGLHAASMPGTVRKIVIKIEVA